MEALDPKWGMMREQHVQPPEPRWVGPCEEGSQTPMKSQ